MLKFPLSEEEENKNKREGHERHQRNSDEPQPFQVNGGAGDPFHTGSGTLGENLIIKKIVIDADEKTQGDQRKSEFQKSSL
jgi:hypothetical protein